MRCLRFALLLAAAPVAAAPKYFVILQGVEGKQDVKTEQVRKLFLDEVARHPDDFAPAQPDFPKEPKELAVKLAALKLKGYFVTVRVLEVGRQLDEPQPGKRGQLARSVKLTLVGATIPDEQVAFGGVGESTAAAIVGKKISPGEEESILGDALKDAIGQAIATALDKLNHPPPPPPPSKKKPHKK